METKDNVNTTTEYVDIEEYYDENADKKYEEKYKPKSMYDKYRKNKNIFVYACLIFAIFLAFLFGPFFKITEISITGSSNVIVCRKVIRKLTVGGEFIIKCSVKGFKHFDFVKCYKVSARNSNLYISSLCTI